MITEKWCMSLDAFERFCLGNKQKGPAEFLCCWSIWNMHGCKICLEVTAYCVLNGNARYLILERGNGHFQRK